MRHTFVAMKALKLLVYGHSVIIMYHCLCYQGGFCRFRHMRMGLMQVDAKK